MQFCGGGHSVKIYTEYLQKTLKGELAKRRKNGSFLSEELCNFTYIQYSESQ
jgi:hypothetical protein